MSGARISRSASINVIQVYMTSPPLGLQVRFNFDVLWLSGAAPKY